MKKQTKIENELNIRMNPEAKRQIIAQAEYWGRRYKEAQRDTLKKIEKLINNYLKKENKICLDIEKEWKLEKFKNNKTRLGINYPRIYSNQYYAFRELQSFWKELKQELTGEKGK